MNQRIRELANIWANRRAEDEKLGIVYTFSEPALEQFAELIVRECMSNLYLNGYDDAIIHIQKHFGVEL